MVEEVRDAAADHKKWLHAGTNTRPICIASHRPILTCCVVLCCVMKLSGLHDLFAAMYQACPQSTHCKELAAMSDSLTNAQLLEKLMGKFYAFWNKDTPTCTCPEANVPAAGSSASGAAPPSGSGDDGSEVEARVVMALDQRVQCARTKSFPGQWIIGTIKKVDATQILVQYDKAPYSEAKGDPPQYWFRVESGNVRVMPDAAGNDQLISCLSVAFTAPHPNSLCCVVLRCSDCI